MDKTWDVIVVGAGVVGSSAAYHLAQEGLETLLIEQFSLGHNRGSSSGRSRVIRRAYVEDYYAQMMPECFEIWHRLAKETDSTLLREVGLLTVEDHKGVHVDTYIDVMKRNKAKYRVFESDKQLRAEYPMFNFLPNTRGLLDPSGAVLYADKCLGALQDISRKRGATILDNTKVEQIQANGTITVHTNRGSYKSKNLVLCTGPWIKFMLRNLGLEIPIQVLPGIQSYWKVKKEGFFAAEKTPMYLHHLNVPKGYQFIYSFPESEYPGMIKVATRGEPLLEPVEPGKRNNENDKTVINFLKDYVKRVFPDLENEPSDLYPCLYTVTPDHKYIIDRHPTHRNIFIAGGMSGYGFKTAPVIGKMIMEMVQERPTSYPIALYSLERFKSMKIKDSNL